MQAENLLDGQWKLVYTSNSELFGLLALSRLPFVSIGDITQKIEGSTLTVENKVRRLLPLKSSDMTLQQQCLMAGWHRGQSVPLASPRPPVSVVWFCAVVHVSWCMEILLNTPPDFTMG